jgi:transposase
MAEGVYVGDRGEQGPELVVAAHPLGECVKLSNDRDGIRQLVARLGKWAPELVVMEATGGLQRQVMAALWSARIRAAAVNPAWVRSFSCSLDFFL